MLYDLPDDLPGDLLSQLAMVDPTDEEKENSRFCWTSTQSIQETKENRIPLNTKKATKWQVGVLMSGASVGLDIHANKYLPWQRCSSTTSTNGSLCLQSRFDETKTNNRIHLEPFIRSSVDCTDILE